MFKLGISLVFAVVSALIIILTGLSSDVRLTTVLLRSLAGFLVAGAVVWLITFFLETRSIVGFDKELDSISEEEDPKSPEEYEAEDAQAAKAEDAQTASDNPENPENSEKNEEEPAEFKPLGAENFRHMEAPSEHA